MTEDAAPTTNTTSAIVDQETEAVVDLDQVIEPTPWVPPTIPPQHLAMLRAYQEYIRGERSHYDPEDFRQSCDCPHCVAWVTKEDQR